MENSREDEVDLVSTDTNQSQNGGDDADYQIQKDNLKCSHGTICSAVGNHTTHQ